MHFFFVGCIVKDSGLSFTSTQNNTVSINQVDHIIKENVISGDGGVEKCNADSILCI